MEVEYNLTAEDLRAFQRRTLARKSNAADEKKSFRACILPAQVFVFSLLMLVFSWQAATFCNWREAAEPLRYFVGGVVCALTGVIMCMAIFAYYLGLFQIRTKQPWEQESSRFHGLKASLFEQGVGNFTESGMQLTYWGAVESIETDSEHLYIYFSPSTGFLIPKRAFGSEEAFGGFLEAAKVYHHAAKASGLALEGKWQPPPSTGIQAPADPGAAKRVEGILPKNQLPE